MESKDTESAKSTNEIAVGKAKFLSGIVGNQMKE
jgi:hypothetical protein